MIRVVVVDDHEMVREAVRLKIKNYPGIKFIAEGTHGEEAIQLFHQLKPDVMILDINMPGKSGLSISRQILNHETHTKVVILTSTMSHFYMRTLRSWGVCGFVNKASGLKELLDAVVAVDKGETYFCKKNAAYMQASSDESSLLASLTDTELDVALMLVSQLEPDSIAKALHIEKKTVYNYKSKVFKKLHVKSLAELVELWVREGMYG